MNFDTIQLIFWKRLYRLKSFFGTKGKPLTPRQQARYEKTQRKIKEKGGMFEFQLVPQSGMHEAFSPAKKIYSRKLKKMADAEGKEKGTRGVPREFIESQWAMVSGPAEKGTGADPKLVELILGKKKGTKKKDVNPEVEYDDSYDLDYDID